MCAYYTSITRMCTVQKETVGGREIKLKQKEIKKIYNTGRRLVDPTHKCFCFFFLPLQSKPIIQRLSTRSPLCRNLFYSAIIVIVI